MFHNTIRLCQVTESDQDSDYAIDGFQYFRFYLATDEYFLFDSARLALHNHGSIDAVINGMQFSEYHRSQGYRQYIVWGTLPITADTTRFLHEVLNRRNEVLIDSQNRIVGIIARDI